MASSVLSLFTIMTFKAWEEEGGCVRDVMSGWLLRILHCHVYKKGAGLAILHVLILQLVVDVITVFLSSLLCAGSHSFLHNNSISQVGTSA